ncbi:MAG TPA: 6-phosphofructokinase, partial [Blastocatellia bacterium]|nr:6-phosphofructokinase [Blastocatellia bacterium]
IVVAEGAKPVGGSLVFQDMGSVDRAPRLGGIAERVADDLTRLTSKDCRVVVLGHLQRGGTPTAFDRVLATCYGSAAVRAIAHGKFGHMVAWRANEILTVPLSECVTNIKTVPPDYYLIGVARDTGISFGGEQDE